MLKNQSILEVKVGDKVYRLYCEPDSSLGEVHDVLVRMRHYVVERIQAAAKEDDKPKEESK